MTTVNTEAVEPSFDQIPWPRLPQRMVVVGLNWLGDAVMAMPALQAFRRCYPQVKICVLSRAPLDTLWRWSVAADEVRPLPKRVTGMRSLAVDLRKQEGYDSACILPNSFRSALVPWMIRVPQRRGVGGQFRDWLLTDVLPRWDDPGVHQVWEYVRLLGLRPCDLQDLQPRLQISEDEADALQQRFNMSGSAPVVLLPGAARGGAKRWPEAHFVSAARILIERLGVSILVMGTRAEEALCEHVARELGDDAVCLAGRTSLRELALLISRSRGVICNDSGGMHLAAALGVPVVAVFGITDPAKTGPLGERSRVVTLPGVQHRRDIPRESAAAQRVLSAIEPARVAGTFCQLVDEAPNDRE